jgi:hypothetical protein
VVPGEEGADGSERRDLMISSEEGPVIGEHPTKQSKRKEMTI